MELGKQIKMLRSEKGLSQDILAEKIFVSRQTISNWETDKSYPDVHSLLLLSQVLGVSIDELIKGDIKMMKEQINREDIADFNRLGYIFAALLAATAITPVLLIRYLGTVGIAVWVVIFAITLYVACLTEKAKKKYDIKTYKEIVAFTEGRTLDEIEKAKEDGKEPYQRIFYAIGAGTITLAISLILLKVTGMI